MGWLTTTTTQHTSTTRYNQAPLRESLPRERRAEVLYQRHNTWDFRHARVWRGWTVSVLGSWFPNAIRALNKMGVRIIFIPTLWKLSNHEGLKYDSRSEDVFVNSTIVARAFVQNVCVLFYNTGGRLRRIITGVVDLLAVHGSAVKLRAEEQTVVN